MVCICVSLSSDSAVMASGSSDLITNQEPAEVQEECSGTVYLFICREILLFCCCLFSPWCKHLLVQLIEWVKWIHLLMSVFKPVTNVYNHLLTIFLLTQLNFCLLIFRCNKPVVNVKTRPCLPVSSLLNCQCFLCWLLEIYTFTL